jgi:hypothetical protein
MDGTTSPESDSAHQFATVEENLSAICTNKGIQRAFRRFEDELDGDFVKMRMIAICEAQESHLRGRKGAYNFLLTRAQAATQKAFTWTKCFHRSCGTGPRKC